MTKELKELINKRILEIYPDDLIPDDEEDYAEFLYEFLSESKYVYSEIMDQRKWYNIVENVVEIDDNVFIKFEWYSAHGYRDLSDMDLSFDLNKVKQVYKKEKTITYYGE